MLGVKGILRVSESKLNASTTHLRWIKMGPSFVKTCHAYNSFMDNTPHHKLSPELERYLALCKRIYERMEREGTWPWKDSTLSADLVESDDNQKNV